MPDIRLQKTVLVCATPNRILGCLQDPLFWSLLPTTFRKMNIGSRPLAIGSTLRPAFERYRLAEVTPESVSLVSENLNLRFTAEPADHASAQLTLDISVLKFDCATNHLLQSVDKDLLAIVDLLDKTPWYGWLPEVRLRFEPDPKGLKMHVSVDIDLPYQLPAVEDVLVHRPHEYRNWIDADVAKHSGTVEVDPSWPARGAVRYQYPRQFWFLPPFGRLNIGSVRLVDWIPGKRVVLSDHTEPGGVVTDRDFELREIPGGAALHLQETASVSAWSARILYGRILRHVIPLETAKSICEFVGVLARLHPPQALSNGKRESASLPG